MFPSELCNFNQWVCWRAASLEGRITKLPYNPRTGQLASVTDPNTWTDYATAVAAASNGNHYSGIGFVLSDNDPYCFIDLDNPENNPEFIARHQKILEAFDTYSEISPSGTGLHLICRAKVPCGRRQKKVEIYSSERYMTMTGATFQDKPIADRNALAMQLWEEMSDTRGGKVAMPVDEPQKYDDEAIYRMAREAENGQKFEDLWQGNWEKYYPSQSEADFALIDILCFYSRNFDQVQRLFCYSTLGKRDKAKRKNYVHGMIKRSFDNQPPAIPLEQIKASVEKQLLVAATERKLSKPTKKYAPIEVPPGLLGELSEFIYNAAPRPVREISIAAAIGLMAGIAGRQYNVSSTGLNQYVLILAKTGTGKEAAASGIDRLMQALRPTVPAAMDFIGPAEIASGQALIKYLGKHPCFVSIVGEFGLVLQQMCSASASLPQVSLRKTLLSLYNKSGHEDMQRSIIYSDKDKNTETVNSPSFSILGESTPESFYINLDEMMIAQGLLPRFTCIEYLGDRPALNRGHATIVPSDRVLQGVGELAANCLVLQQHNRFIDVTLNPEAQQFSEMFNHKCDLKINGSDMEVARQLWNRAHIKTLKLAALIAIGLNPYQPTIDLPAMEWSASLVERDVLNILQQFETGKAGKDTGELNQINQTAHIIREYLTRPFAGLEKYQVIPQMHADHVISSSYLQRRLLVKNPFQHDRLGATAALKRVLDSFVSEGSIREIRSSDVYARYGKTMKCYIILDTERFTKMQDE